MATDYNKLIEDLKAANKVASEAAAASDDGGTANLDSVFLTLPRAREVKVLEAIQTAGLYCRGKRKWIGEGYRITPTSGGQGNKRAKGVEVMAKELRDRGWNALVFYKMD